MTSTTHETTWMALISAEAIERNESWNAFSLSVRVSASELANILSIALPDRGRLRARR